MPNQETVMPSEWIMGLRDRIKARLKRKQVKKAQVFASDDTSKWTPHHHAALRHWESVANDYTEAGGGKIHAGDVADHVYGTEGRQLHGAGSRYMSPEKADQVKTLAKEWDTMPHEQKSKISGQVGCYVVKNHVFTAQPAQQFCPSCKKPLAGSFCAGCNKQFAASVNSPNACMRCGGFSNPNEVLCDKCRKTSKMLAGAPQSSTGRKPLLKVPLGQKGPSDFATDLDSDLQIASEGANQASQRAHGLLKTSDVLSRVSPGSKSPALQAFRRAHQIAHRAHVRAASLASAAGNPPLALEHIEKSREHEKYFASLSGVPKSSLAPVQPAKPLDTSPTTGTASKKAFATGENPSPLNDRSGAADLMATAARKAAKKYKPIPPLGAGSSIGHGNTSPEHLERKKNPGGKLDEDIDSLLSAYRTSKNTSWNQRKAFSANQSKHTAATKLMKPDHPYEQRKDARANDPIARKVALAMAKGHYAEYKKGGRKKNYHRQLAIAFYRGSRGAAGVRENMADNRSNFAAPSYDDVHNMSHRASMLSVRANQSGSKMDHWKAEAAHGKAANHHWLKSVFLREGRGAKNPDRIAAAKHHNKMANGHYKMAERHHSKRLTARKA